MGILLLNHWLLWLSTEPLELFFVGGHERRFCEVAPLCFPDTMTDSPALWFLPSPLLFFLWSFISLSSSPLFLSPFPPLFPFLSLHPLIFFSSIFFSSPSSLPALVSAPSHRLLAHFPAKFLHPGRPSGDLGVDFITDDNFLSFHPKALSTG